MQRIVITPPPSPSRWHRLATAGLVMVSAFAFGIGLSAFKPTPITSSSQIVVTIEAPVVNVPALEWPTATATATVTPTPTPYPTTPPIPTWGGQRDGGLYQIPPMTPTPRPPVVHRLCVRATPVPTNPMTCLGVPFDLPEGWFA